MKEEASKATATEADAVNGDGASEAEAEESSSVPKRSKKKGRRVRTKDDKSLVKLASSDDLLGRRMHGLAGGLTGLPVDAD